MTQSAAITADDFATAMNNGQLSLVYQPIVDLKAGQPQGFEALMRWTHPVHGAIPPNIFIPIAEESGLIIAASRWAMRESCRALKRICGALGYDVSLFMSVNFSATDLTDENFLEQLYTVISAVDIDPSRVHIEITEQLLKAQPDQARATLGLCRKAGLGISIDDVNADSSSLEDLHGFNVDTIKIDDIDDEGAQALIAKARTLGMTTIAEGVETAESAAALRAMGCDLAQGYYFARPMEEPLVIDTLRQWMRSKSA